MRYIKRFSKPEILSKKEREWTEKFLQSGEIRPESSKYANPKIKKTLFSMSYNKCFYCEALLKDTSGTASYKEIDHFLEVSEVREKAYEWNNLYLSCPSCNDKIPNKDIPVSEVLDPCQDQDIEIQKHLKFEDEIIQSLTPKGIKTIQKFRLDTDRQDYLRLQILKKFLNTYRKIRDMMIEEGREDLNEKEREILNLFQSVDRPYSLMFSLYLQKLRERI